jgi:putative SOS response-associated peptidase YedK
MAIAAAIDVEPAIPGLQRGADRWRRRVSAQRSSARRSPRTARVRQRPSWLRLAATREPRVASAVCRYARRRCILPVDGFFEWKAIKGTKAKQPFAIAMHDGSPFGIAGIWENWKDPAGEWQRTFAVITVPSNELVAQIHDRMPAILRPQRYDRWLGDDPDPRDLLQSYPAELMCMWPISTRVNKPENDDPSILDPIEALAEHYLA